MVKKKKKLVIQFSMFLRANSVESNPPLSTILGNYGVNTVAFCKEINEYTKDLPNYFLLEVIVLIKEDRSFSFSIKKPTVAFLLKLCAHDFTVYKQGQGGLKEFIVKTINLKDLYLISIYIYGCCNDFTLKSIYGVLRSSRYLINL
jgi:large subunit ribosomal protein L11